MQITEVRIKLVSETTNPLAFACIEFDKSFVVHDLKVVKGAHRDVMFIAMPSRRKMDRCGRCGTKNHLRAAYCNHCGEHLDPERSPIVAGEKNHYYSDIGHPISSPCRRAIEAAVIEAYKRELEAAKLPGYVCRYEPATLEI